MMHDENDEIDPFNDFKVCKCCTHVRLINIKTGLCKNCTRYISKVVNKEVEFNGE